MIKLSIIIPVYNTEKYVVKCIESCLAQNIARNEYEIILVDDGSSDNSLKIISEIANKEENVYVFTQVNQKQGAARNRGLQIARGQYIWFVDSDDWISHNILKTLLEFVNTDVPDLLRFDALDCISATYKKKRTCTHKVNYRYTDTEAILENQFSVCTPFYFFNAKFLKNNNLFFVEKIFYEDTEFMMRVFEKLKLFQYYPVAGYNVRIREESTTRGVNYNNKLDMLSVVRTQVDYVSTHKINNKVECVFHKHIAINMNTLLTEVSPSAEYFGVVTKQLGDIDGLYKSICKSKSLRHYVEYKMLAFPRILRFCLQRYYKTI